MESMTGRTAQEPRDALALIVAQHDRIQGLITRLEDDALPTDRRTAVCRELAHLIAAHAAMEERLFYPAVRARQTEEILLSSSEEHLAIRRALDALMATRVADERWQARLAVLEEEIEHHAREEEEQVLFPKLRRVMTEEELVVLGAEMRALFDRLMH